MNAGTSCGRNRAMENIPKFQQRLNAWRPELQVKPITSCFKRKIDTEFPYITAILRHDEIAFSASAYSARSIDKAAKLLTEALSLSDKYDLELRGDNVASTLSLFRDMYWKNIETGAFVVANFRVDICFEPTTADCVEANPYFDLLMDAAVVGGRYDMQAKWPDNPKNIVGLRSVCEKFYNFMEKARCHPDILAPFGRFDELPPLPGVREGEIYRISYKNRNGVVVQDRFCGLRRSIYSMPKVAKIKWIEGYSEEKRMMLDIKLTDILSIDKEVEVSGFFGSKTEIRPLILPTSGVWPL